MPNLHLPSFSPARKKPRIPPYTEFPFEGQLFDPAAFPSNPLPLGPHPHPHHDQNHGFAPFFPFPDSSSSAGIQGARHAQFGPSFSDLHIGNLQQSLLFSGILFPDHHAPHPPRISTDLTIGSPHAGQDAACSLSSGAKKPDDVKATRLVLFGRAILTEEQIKANASVGPSSLGATGNGSSKSDCDAEKAPTNTSEGSSSGVIQGSPTKNSSSSWRLQWFGDNGSQSPSEFGLEPGQCKVFVESDAVGRNLDLSALGSFEELYTRLSDMFCIDNAELRSHVLYSAAAGEVKHVGDEPFR
uniref:PB1 domain-containing protein n=1 Tax=Arundo donax TaxID=35708 RepID=A0A0A9B7L5_ARUDO